MGRRHRPFYRLNAVEKRTQRDGRVLENLGWYNPMEKDAAKQVELNADRIKHWLSQGAQATDTVNDLLARHEVIDAAAWTAKRESKRKKNYQAAIAKKQAEEEAKRAEEEAARKAAEEAAAAKAAEEAKAAEGGSEAEGGDAGESSDT
jgi:small subunit ribosomal protein S16